MLPMTSFPVFFGGALVGICILVVLLGIIIGHAYNERMLWWHSAATGAALAALVFTGNSALLITALWTLQLALSTQSLLVTCGSSGAMQLPARVLRFLTVAIALGVAAAAGLDLQIEKHPGMLCLPWALLTGWYLFRAHAQSRPWIFWIAGGYAALIAHYLLLELMFARAAAAEAWGLASVTALAVNAAANYLGMVWSSRLRSENSLRVEAREKTDPLTGLATPRVFFDRTDGALMRSHQLGYTCTLLLIRIGNINRIVEERQLDSSESVILAAARAIASTLRTQDTAARLGNNRFAVIAEAIPGGTSRLLATQILAHGMRADECGLPGSELHFQIALVEIDHSSVRTQEVLAQLDQVLQDMSTTDVSHIKPLPNIGPGQRVPVAASAA